MFAVRHPQYSLTQGSVPAFAGRLCLPLLALFALESGTPAQVHRPRFVNLKQLSVPINTPGSQSLGMSLNFNELQAVIASDRAGGKGAGDLILFRRKDHQTAFAQLQGPVDALNTAADETEPELTRIGDAIFFASDRSGGKGGYDIYVAKRPADEGPFGAPAVLAVLNSPADDTNPALSRDSLELLFVSDRPGSLGGMSIWRATRADDESPWSAPKVVSEVDSSADETSPTLTKDGRVLFFASNRQGGQGFDIYAAVRSDSQSPFGAPTRVAELSGPRDEIGIKLSPQNAGVHIVTLVGGVGVISRADYDGAVQAAMGDPIIGANHFCWVQTGRMGDLALTLLSLGRGAPIPMPGVGGAFELDPVTMLVLDVGVTDANGMKGSILNLPVGVPSGFPLHVQTYVYASAQQKSWFSNPVGIYTEDPDTELLSSSCWKKLKSCIKDDCGKSIPWSLAFCAAGCIPTFFAAGVVSYAGCVLGCTTLAASNCVKDCLKDYINCLY